MILIVIVIEEVEYLHASPLLSGSSQLGALADALSACSADWPLSVQTWRGWKPSFVERIEETRRCSLLPLSQHCRGQMLSCCNLRSHK